MTISKRGEFYHYRFMLDGQLFRGSTKEKSVGKAKQFEAMLMTKIREGGANQVLRRAPLLSEFAPHFLRHIDKCVEAGQLAKNTQEYYHRGWKLLSETDVAGRRVDQIHTAHAATLQFPFGPSTANTALRTLSRMLSYAEEKGLVKATPRIKLLREVQRDAVVEPWLEELLLEFAPPYLGDVITIMLDAGMRPEEVRRMRWEHVYLDRNTILVPNGKTLRSRRHVGITDRIRERLQRIMAEQGAQPSEWVFPSTCHPPSATGHRSEEKKIWSKTLTVVRAAAKERGLPDVPKGLVLYSCRHTFATNFLSAGGDIGKLMAVMGHSSMLTCQRYIHPSTAGSAELMNEHNRANERALSRLHLVKSA
jgi:integrase